MLDFNFMQFVVSDWRVTIIFLGVLFLSVPALGPTFNRIADWIFSLVLTSAVVAILIGTSGLLLEYFGFVTDNWEYTRFVWRITWPMWVVALAIMIVWATWLIMDRKSRRQAERRKSRNHTK